MNNKDRQASFVTELAKLEGKELGKKELWAFIGKTLNIVDMRCIKNWVRWLKVTGYVTLANEFGLDGWPVFKVTIQKPNQ